MAPPVSIINFMTTLIYMYIVLTVDNMTVMLTALASLLQQLEGHFNLNLTPTNLFEILEIL